jgi:hypothetical protein
MSTKIRSAVVRLLVSAGCVIVMASCGGEMLRTGRSPMYLVVNGVSAGGSSGFLMSDVQVEGSVVNDPATVSVSSIAKNLDAVTTPVNTITLTRYHVDFRRADGRNTPGVHVPYGFDGALSVTVPPSGTASVVFVLVRHQAKEEPPLRNLRNQGDQALISTIAEITLYGHDQNGNEVTVVCRMDVHFGDFADP